jgi:hypothetical protein
LRIEKDSVAHPQSDRWGRGRFYCERIESPAPLKNIPRYFRRFGVARTRFTDYLRERGPFDYVLIQTMMTYWSRLGGRRRPPPGVASGKIVLGALCGDRSDRHTPGRSSRSVPICSVGSSWA